jgi:hypothetical protein
MPRRPLVFAVLGLAVVAAGACAAPRDTATPSPSPAPDGLSSCTDGPVTREQLAGSWREQPNGPVAHVLSQVGVLTTIDPDGAQHTGKWQYLPVEQTPVKDTVSGQVCVLWLHESAEPDADFFYVPLRRTDTTVELSYVGRGNTLAWYR